jgi:subtilisin family serine protease
MQLRRPRPTRFVALAAAALIGCGGSAALASPAPSSRILVKFRAGATPTAAHNALSSVDASELRTIRGVGVHVATVSSDRAARVLAALRRNRAVSYAEVDGRVAPQDLLPSDPSFPQQFAVAGGAWGWTKTHTTQAWDVTKGDPSIIVAILDTGLKTGGLSDFDGQVVPGWNVMKGTADTSSSAGNHGTYVAGVVGLALNNGAGNAGYCPGCKLMPIQVGTDSGASWSDLAAGITWAADHGARVENMSWAGTSSSATIANAVAYARARGVALTAAAGNSNCDCPTYPSATPGVIGVAGTTTTDAKDGDSNFGSWVTVAAPESNMTAWPTLNGSPGYAPVGGTSLAAPVVAAIAGLLFSANPALSGSQVEQAIETSAVPVGFAVKYGRVDAIAALSSLGLAGQQSPAAPTPTTAPSIYIESNGDYNYRPLVVSPAVGNVLLRGQGAWSGSAPLQVQGVQWQRCDPVGGACATVSSTSKYTVQAGDAGFALRLMITVGNGVGSTMATSALSLPVGGSVPTPPLNTAPPAITGGTQVGQTLSASTGAWSGSPTTYAYQWRRCDAAGGTCSDIAGAVGPAYAAQWADTGSTLRVAVTASNAAGTGVAMSAQTGAVTAAPSVQPEPSGTQTSTFTGSLSPKYPSRSFTINTGSGATHAELSFAKCSTLALRLSSGSAALASANGPSIVTIDVVVPRGTLTYEVSGGRCSFSLAVTAPSA